MVGNPYLFIGPKKVATLSVTALVAALRRVGRNETATVQLEPAAIVAPAVQVPDETTKGPLVANDTGPSAALPLLARVTACAALVAPTLVEARIRLDGAALAAALPLAAPGLPR